VVYQITQLSFDLERFAYVLTADGNEYLKVQTELLLKILEATAKLNVRFAVPFAESMSVPNDQAKGAKESAAVDTLV
jgi:hypothetical protein